jgi:DNA-binding response OmpR family regulator
MVTPVAPEVELLHWPRDADRRQASIRAQRPRLLIIGPGTVPPSAEDEFEDWVRDDADERDVAARMRTLATRAEASLLAVVLVDDRCVQRGPSTVPLSRLEARLMERLLAAPGELVGRGELEAAVWPGGPPSHTALDDVSYRLRRRVRVIGLDVLAERGHGLMLTLHVPIDPAMIE